MKKFNQKVLHTTVSMIMTLSVCGGISLSKASDIEIYKDATLGKTSILMMLDTSGSMGISSLVLPKNNKYGSPGDVDSSLCDRVSVSEYYSNGTSTSNIYEWAYNLKDELTGKTAIRKTVTIGGTTVPYYMRGCSKNGVKQYDRLSRLKDAILPLLASTDISDEVLMGLGQFSSKTELTIGDASNRLTDGHSGRILVPNAPLTTAQRIKIAQQIAAIKSLDTTTDEDGTTNTNLKLSSKNYPNVIKASSGTPTVHAYAEAGAYMMGTGTGTGGTNGGKVSTIYDGYMVMQNGSEQVYFICVAVSSSTTSALGATVKQCINNWPSYDSANKSVSTGTLSAGVYNADGVGIKSQNLFKSQVGEMNSGWETFTKLPEGWRYGGWMKVNNEPMDIEPIVGTVWSGYAGGTIGIVSYRTNPFLVSGSSDNLIGGFAYSANDTKNGSVYQAGGSTSSCDGNGIYFLTDGAPNSTKDAMARTIMNTTLNNDNAYKFSAKPSGIGVLLSPTLQSGLFEGETGGWEYIGEYSKKLLDPTKNPKGMKIKTAVVGFGTTFAGIKQADGTYNCDAVTGDAYNACKWGSSEFGDGGFYYAENSADIRNSIISFVQKAKADIEPVATGSPTIPQDALNPLQLQPYGYYASFTPKPQAVYRLWLGNLNKYHIYNGELYSSDKTLKLITDTGALNKDAQGIWTGGALAQLPLGTLINTQTNVQSSNRTIYTNRQITGSGNTYTANEIDVLKQVNLISLFDSDSSKALFKNDPNKNYWLNLLGYNVASNASITLDNLSSQPELRQMGSVMHSTPILLTQEGKITYTGNVVSSTNRKDYLLFGNTQGLLQVLNASTGKEEFAFVPNEMMENQKDAFLVENSTIGGKSNLFYGIDAPWTAYTQYVTKSDGTLTVKDSGRTTNGSNDANLALKGLQWVYGGLRMGGRSYYALDLSDIDKPSLKFHINPDGSASGTALAQMGQSWSKPTLGYINWGGMKKLVMFVGGGYDSSYENPTYNSTNIDKGSGVYMFDASNGDLLWWASAANGTGATQHTIDVNMKYSVVSQINAVDRNADGLIDHLYFGDLGGQAFRIDFDNTATTTANFVKRSVLLFSEHISGGKSPRFYEMPSVSIHQDNGAYFAVVAFSSGNRSSPLSISANSASDGVFVVYDKDVARSDLYTTTVLNTQAVTLSSLNLTTGVIVAGNNGWKYIYSNNAGRYKGMNDIYALDSILYVNVFDRDGSGIGGSCGAGVAGDSYLYQFCLPTGKCGFYGTETTQPNRVKLGAGILGAGLGQGYNNSSGNVGLVVTRPTTLDCSQSTNKNLPECQLFNTTARLQQLRWYESR